MKILVTGAKGFVGRNLCSQLKNIKDGKARNYGVTVTKVYEYDLNRSQLLDFFVELLCCYFTMFHGAKDAIIRAPSPTKTPTETPAKPTKLEISGSRSVVFGIYDEKEDADWRPVLIFPDRERL